MPLTIGFYGDSFCCETSNPHSIAKGYDTYIEKLRTHHDAKITNLGYGGSSVWDVILKQFDESDVPDISIFCWTDYNRLYDAKLRNITKGSIENKQWKDYSFKDLFFRKKINAAAEYFKYLHDYEKAGVEQKAALQYFDLNVLSKVKSKIIHMWSFKKTYNWKHGVEIETPLYNFVNKDANGFETWAANHIGGDKNNQDIFELINAQHRLS